MSAYSLKNNGRRVSLLAAGAMALVSRGADAMQPLTQFVDAAHHYNADNREAAATMNQRAAETQQSRYHLLPVLSARAGYTRNQYEVVATFPQGTGQPAHTATITPQDQFEASLTLDVPLIDVGAWSRIGAAQANEDAAHARVASTSFEIDRQVSRAYFQIVAARAVLASAQRSVDVSERNHAQLTERRAAGLASELDVERARAEIERGRQTVAEAELSASIATRTLETLSGIVPSGVVPALPDDLHEEAPLSRWESSVSRVPGVRAAELDVRAADATTTAIWYGLLPTVAASATERFTNAVGFGYSPTWAAGVALTWRGDVSAIAVARGQSAAAEAARARLDRSLRAARDAVHNDWQQVHSSLVRSNAARSQLAASTHAAQIAHDRYAQGLATQLDVLQADRDAFAADVARIQADADLAYARVLLRIDAGQGLDASTGVSR